MRIPYRIFVIVIVGLLIGGMFYGVVATVSSGVGQSSALERQDGAQFTQTHHDDVSGGIQFPSQAGKNFAIITLICVVYLKASKLLEGRKLNFPTG